jgi:hypothetical protein
MLPAVALPPGQERAEEVQRMLQEGRVARGDDNIPRLDLSRLSLEPLNAEFLAPFAAVTQSFIACKAPATETWR